MPVSHLFTPLSHILILDPDAVHLLAALFVALKSSGISFFYLHILFTLQFYKLAKLVPEVGAAAKADLCPPVAILVYLLSNRFLFSHSLLKRILLVCRFAAHWCAPHISGKPISGRLAHFQVSAFLLVSEKTRRIAGVTPLGSEAGKYW